MIRTIIQAPRALEIPEIIKEILSYHTPRASTVGNIALRRDAGTILACTICCKAFSDIALDLLWSEMIDLCPLFLLLPGVALLNDNLFIGGELHEDTCSRFWSYGRRVRRLVLPMVAARSSKGRSIHISVYSRLALRFPGRAILPLLEHLEYTVKDTGGMATYALEFPMLLSGTVRWLQVVNRADEKTGGVLLSFLIDNASQLKFFAMEGLPPRFFVSHSLRLTSLRSLLLSKCDDTFPDLAPLLENLPHLLSIYIGVTSEWAPSSATNISTNLLPNLRCISVRGPEKTCLLLLQHLSGRMLIQGRIAIGESWLGRGRGRDCLTHLSRFTSLRELALDIECECVDALMILDPLLGSIPIQHLRLTLSHRVTVSNDTIRGITSGFKNLQTLKVSYARLKDKTCSIDYRALETIALYSPNLLELTISINLSDLTDQNIPRSSCATSLRSLDLVTSDCDMALTRQFIEAVFPKLENLVIRRIWEC